MSILGATTSCPRSATDSSGLRDRTFFPLPCNVFSTCHLFVLPYYIRSLIPSRPLSPLPIRSVLPPRAHSVRADGLSPIFIDIASSSSRRLQSLALLSGAIAGTLVRKIAGSSHGTCRSITRRPCHLSRVRRPPSPRAGGSLCTAGQGGRVTASASPDINVSPRNSRACARREGGGTCSRMRRQWGHVSPCKYMDEFR